MAAHHRSIADEPTPPGGALTVEPGASRAPMSGLVDHSYLDNGRGVLFCVAGSEHTRELAVGCPYYLRRDVVESLPAIARPGWRSDARPSLWYRGEPHFKITALADPAGWRALVGALPPEHGVWPLSWSLFNAQEFGLVARVIEPREALRAAFGSAPDHERAWHVVAYVLDRLGDPSNCDGSLGLTGSAALCPERLRDVADVDLLVFPTVDRGALRDAVRELGGRFLAELDEGDDRLAAFLGSRIMPATTDQETRRRLWARRLDVLWFDSLRVDLTDVPDQVAQVDALPYATPSVGRFEGEVTVVHVAHSYPVDIRVDSPTCARVVVTARGYQGAFRPRDRLAVLGARHIEPAGAPFVSVDDAAGHMIRLLP